MKYNANSLVKLIAQTVLVSLLLVVSNAYAGIIHGKATDLNSTAEVGNTRYIDHSSKAFPELSGDYIKYYVPLDSHDDINSPYTYGVNGGTSADYGNVYDNTYNPEVVLNMFVHFVIPEGEKGDTIKVTFKDLDLLPNNDPRYFNERLFLGGAQFGQGDIAEAQYDDWGELHGLQSNGLTYSVNKFGVPDEDIDEFNFKNNYITLTISGLNLSAGDHWFRMGFQAYSCYDGTLKNTAEYLKAELHTSVQNVNVPEPSTVFMLMFGLIAVFTARAKLKS